MPLQGVVKEEMGISVSGERKTEMQSCKDMSETHSAAGQEQTRRLRRCFWEQRSWRTDQARILLMQKITKIKLKFSFLLYSNLKSTDWVILNLKYYGPGAGTDHSASFHLGCCHFLEKLTTTGVWTGTVGTFLFGIMVLCHLRAQISLYSVVQHRISRSCYCNCNSKLGLKLSKLLKGSNCLKEMALFPPDQLFDHCPMASCVFLASGRTF